MRRKLETGVSLLKEDTVEGAKRKGRGLEEGRKQIWHSSHTFVSLPAKRTGRKAEEMATGEKKKKRNLPWKKKEEGEGKAPRAFFNPQKEKSKIVVSRFFPFFLFSSLPTWYIRGTESKKDV